MKWNNYPCVVSIAGTDPSGGAGIHADIKAISATGAYAAAIVAALVAQNTQGVQAILPVASEFVATQIESVFSDLSVAATKIGMLHTRQNIALVAATIQQYQLMNVVLDPVVAAKNGAALLDKECMYFMQTHLFPRVTLITPNLLEAEVIMGEKINSHQEMAAAAEKMGKQFATNILLKGGHLNTQDASDVLYLYAKNACEWFRASRIDTVNTHGTGCSLSAAIASFLAQQYSLQDAVAAAKKYITTAIAAGKTMKIGKGFGPIDHFYQQREGHHVR